ncbi:hypothetical protein SDRG_12161 [Saprolegnia diclina VS20]|uniref:Uncharacterized protein n=1 Tax=Saprolegnia diclina (strain VS20) TaxID=1156394 RepID=T0RJP3_SAPDV|nr:hypothetical protein SDRG_12161 [Saprolegnia diclina VS20]EQC30102.1 hypothetical protein SDRG_12161 [Saprolegnia diclina VS20]|eukprot:XP_008616445.1 hypothetical protein SDRG_12161 [Saprolegnia diclina VS20]
MPEGPRRKHGREPSKRPFVFKTPQKVASPFVFTKKARRHGANDIHHAMDDDDDGDFLGDESLLPERALFGTPSRAKAMRRPTRREPTPDEVAIRAKLVANQEHHRLQMFDTLCTQLHKRIVAQTQSAAKETCTKKQVVHVLEKAAAVIKDQFASNEPTEEEAKPQQETVHAILTSLEEKLASLQEQEKEWRSFLETVPATLAALAAAAPPVITEDVRPAGSRGQASAQELAHEQTALCQRVVELKDQLRFLDISIEDLERMMHVSQATRSSLFDSFHASEFKGYAHMQAPKDAIKALMALFS